MPMSKSDFVQNLWTIWLSDPRLETNQPESCTVSGVHFLWPNLLMSPCICSFKTRWRSEVVLSVQSSLASTYCKTLHERRFAPFKQCVCERQWREKVNFCMQSFWKLLTTCKLVRNLVTYKPQNPRLANGEAPSEQNHKSYLKQKRGKQLDQLSFPDFSQVWQGWFCKTYIILHTL